MMYDLSEAILSNLGLDMTFYYPAFTESLQGKDSNFETAQSSTLRPLRLQWTHNVVLYTLGYVFIQTDLKGLGEWTGTESCDNWGGRRIGDVFPSETMAEEVKEQLMDPTALGLSDVEILTNLSRA